MAERPLSIDIRHPLILKANDLVLLTQEDGNFPLEIPGFGLFYRDTCYLGGYRLNLNDTKPLMLMASDSQGIAAQIELTNSAASTANGDCIPDHKLSLRRTLVVLEEGPTFVDTITLRSFAHHRIELPISLEFQTTFEHVRFARCPARPSAAGCLPRYGRTRRCVSVTKVRRACDGRCSWTSPSLRSSRPGPASER